MVNINRGCPPQTEKQFKSFVLPVGNILTGIQSFNQEDIRQMNTKIISNALLALTLFTPLGVWAAGASNTEESCLATFSVSDQTLTIPCVEVVMGNETVPYSAQLQQVEEGSFALTQVVKLLAAVESECVASYSLETGELGVPCVEEVNPPWKTESQGMRLQALEPSTPKMFVISDRTPMSQLRSIASDEGTSEVSQEDTKKASLGVLKYLQENGLINLPPDTEVDSLESYLNQKGLKLNIVVLKPAGFLILSSDYSHDVIIDFSAQKWEAHFGYLDVFTGRDDRPEIYKNKWKQFIEQGSEGLRHREVRSGDDCAVGEECRRLYTVRWDQSGRKNVNSVDYNSEMPTGPSGIKTPNGRCYAGCVAVATAQIMNYHKYPSYSPISGIRYNWNNDLFDTFDTSLATLLEELNNMGRASCEITGTGIYREDMLGPFKAYGYTIDSNDDLTAKGMYSFAKKHIDQNRPVLLWGQKWTASILGFDISTRGYNHLVVVEGYKKVTGSFDDDHFLYINYGWGGYGDRWWLIDTLADWLWSDRLAKKSLDALIPIFWTGNGSIISYHRQRANTSDDQYPYGIEKDLTTLHPGSPVAFFQWQVTKGSCDRLSIFAKSPNDVKRADITVGSWDSRSSDRLFENVSLPFVIGEGNTGIAFPDAGWYVVSVAFKDAVTQFSSLYAECTSQSPSYQQSVAGKPVLLNGGYKWNGNASIISRLFSHLYGQNGQNFGGEWPFGVFHDVTKVSPSPEKPVVFFQWMASDMCTSLTIDSPDLGYSEKQVKISSKQWSSSSYDTQSGTLPMTLYNSNVGSPWRVIQVAFESPVSKTASVTAKCPGF
ncbi:MAG: hypothetical protein BWK78_06775 [Thiotrichaceae bacterium IS1]|nr:MAG: hypothetical protein BWK78_06775 [Thiotrichaceae bacterium IS1]